MGKRIIANLLMCCFVYCAFGQTITLEGYVFEENNRGYIKDAQVTIIEAETSFLRHELVTDNEGFFTAQLEPEKAYKIRVNHTIFFTKSDSVSTIGVDLDKKVYTKTMLKRRPGYIFDVTIAEPRGPEDLDVVDAIDSARIEVFNNTLDKAELELINYPHPNFKFNFVPGNHYTIMIRRKGYFNKRIEAYVNVEGCILCFDGLGNVRPNVIDIMTSGNDIGTFLSNIELQPLEINKVYRIDNIYYDLNKDEIRSDAAIELDKLLITLKDNPGVTIEMGSHTDSRGSGSSNMELSERRAQSAVEYLVTKGNLDPTKLLGRGYGETQLTNKCANGVKCSEKMHQKNRRTEIRVLGIEEEDPLDKKTLAEIIREEKLLEEVLNQEIIKVPEGANPEDYGIKNEPPVEKQNAPDIKMDYQEEAPFEEEATKGVQEAIEGAVEKVEEAVEGEGGGGK